MCGRDKNLFVYGTLLVPEIIQTLLGCELSGKEVVLKGYRCGLVVNECFPGIFPIPGNETRGLLYTDVTSQMFCVFDKYEGDWYERTEVTVFDSEDLPEAAYTYVIKPEHRNVLSQREWVLETFVSHHMDSYLWGLANGCNDI